MPTMRKRRARGRIAEVSPAMVAYLETGAYPARGEAGCWEVLDKSGGGEALRADWLEVRDAVLARWIAAHPGTRPLGWWLFDAPCWQRANVPGCGQDIGDAMLARFADPRRRLGGTGTPDYEVLNVMPNFDRGIPTGWVTRWDEDFYNGRSRDVHGKPIGTEYHEGHFSGRGVDPHDPPTFESEAAYLDRHGLLTAAERRRLPAGAFDPEVLALDADDLDGDEADAHRVFRARTADLDDRDWT